MTRGKDFKELDIEQWVAIYKLGTNDGVIVAYNKESVAFIRTFLEYNELENDYAIYPSSYISFDFGDEKDDSLRERLQEHLQNICIDNLI